MLYNWRILGLEAVWLQLRHYPYLGGPRSLFQPRWTATGSSLPARVSISPHKARLSQSTLVPPVENGFFKSLLLCLCYYAKAGESSFFPFAPIIELTQEWHVDGFWKGSGSDISTGLKFSRQLVASLGSLLSSYYHVFCLQNHDRKQREKPEAFLQAVRWIYFPGVLRKSKFSFLPSQIAALLMILYITLNNLSHLLLCFPRERGDIKTFRICPAFQKDKIGGRTPNGWKQHEEQHGKLLQKLGCGCVSQFVWTAKHTETHCLTPLFVLLTR